jgi:predicted RNase H-like nuclease
VGWLTYTYVEAIGDRTIGYVVRSSSNLEVEGAKEEKQRAQHLTDSVDLLPSLDIS